MELLQIVDMAVAGGYVLALALVCLLQYMLYVFRLTEMKKQRQQDRELMEGLEGNLQEAERDRTLSRLENSILREFVSETDLDRALEMLLRRFLPDAAADCGAFLQILEDGTQQLLRSRGLTHDEANRLQLDDDLLERLQREHVVALSGVDQDLLWTAGNAELPGGSGTRPGSGVPELRRQELLLLAIHDTDDLEGVMLTSRLYPAGAPRTHQLELAMRLMVSMAANFRQSRILRQKEYQLWSTREMLELRAITDGTYETPLKMVEAFLRCLRKQVRADRAVLYVTPASESGTAHLLAAGDGTPSGGLPGDTVSDSGGFELCNEVVTIDADELLHVSGAEQAGRGLVVPLSSRGQLIGRVCLSRNDRQEFSRRETELAGWAAEYLSEAIHRVLSHVVVQRQALQDGLTELANRRAFDEQLQREVETARREDSQCVLLLIDLDRFKLINDEYGHQAGDAVLRNVANTLRDQVMRMRSGDRALVARYGGEELAVLLPGVPVAGARRIAEGMRAAIADCGTEWNEQPLAVTASIGLAEFPSMAETSAELVARADAALYHAKQSGRNRVCIPTVAGSFTTGGTP